MSNLDKIEEFEQFTFKQWIAFATAAGGIDVVKNVMRGKVRLVVETVRRLTTLISFTLPANNRTVHDHFDTHHFFHTRNGLYLSDDFEELVFAAKRICPLIEEDVTFGYCDLAEAASDDEIRSELPEEHVFTDVNVFLVVLAALIEAQWLNEAKGILLNTKRRRNIFYVEVAGTVFIVYVSWDVSDGNWRCRAYHADADRWLAGDRVFSATDVLTA